MKLAPRPLALLATLHAFAPAFAGNFGGPAQPEGVTSICGTLLSGLGICGGIPQPCGADCSAATPCPDGSVCVVESGCETKLAGACIVPLPDGGCSNPGTETTGFEACEPVVFHEDFGISKPVGPEGPPPGLDKLSVSTLCGSGGMLFKETACDLNDFASSPLATARWGIGPASCASYASASHRVVASTGWVDVSKCARSQLDFDYALALVEDGQFDRVFVTALGGFLADPGRIVLYEPVLATNQSNPTAQAFTTSALSCAGSVLPVGKLIQDGDWHHFDAELGDYSTVLVNFYAETYDNVSNGAQGFFFDDVRIDCTDLIFDEGFEGGNFLPWSFTTAPPLLVEVDADGPQPGSCGTYRDCGGPGSGCFNIATPEGNVYCIDHPECEFVTLCEGSGDCAADEVCAVDTCCGTVCTPARCTPETILLGPEAATAPGV